MKKIILSFTGFLVCTSSFACYETSITNPSPFMGNNDEIFTLADGSVWQVKYEYEYLYEYHPDVIICPDKGVLVVDGKRLNVKQLSNRGSAESSSSVIEARIDGESEGWDGETIYLLDNGQIWQQSEHHYEYHYSYSPRVTIFEFAGGYKMQIEGTGKAVGVTRLR